MTQDHHAGLKPRSRFNLAAQETADAPELHVAELVADPALLDLGPRFSSLGQSRSFRHDHDAEIFSSLVALAEVIANLIDVHGPLRNENRIGAAGHPGRYGDPARIPPHYFNHHDSIVGLRGGVQTVNGVGRDVDGRVESETIVRCVQVVVDGLGNTDDGDALLEQAVGNAHRIVAPDGNQRVERVALEVSPQPFHAVRVLERVGARGAQDGPAAVQDSGDALQIKRFEFVFEQAAPSFQDSKAFPAQQVGLADYGADDRIQAGTVASTRQDTDSSGHCTAPFSRREHAAASLTMLFQLRAGNKPQGNEDGIVPSPRHPIAAFK